MYVGAIRQTKCTVIYMVDVQIDAKSNVHGPMLLHVAHDLQGFHVCRVEEQGGRDGREGVDVEVERDERDTVPATP